MTDRPYTDDDLRAEAARQHAVLTEDPDFMGVGEQLDGTPIPSTVVDLEPETGEPLEMSRAWSSLSDHDFEQAQDAIHGLIGSAADVSEWAVNLGADGLEPDGTLQLGVRGPNPGDPEQPVVRLHFAFPKGMSHDDRSRLLMRLSAAVSKGI